MQHLKLDAAHLHPVLNLAAFASLQERDASALDGTLHRSTATAGRGTPPDLGEVFSMM
jgi:hypothetical protein